MQIRRVALIVMVGLAPVTTALAGDHVATPEPKADASAPTTTLRPAEPVARPVSPTLPEYSSREKTLALLILMLREGRGAR
jgi:hypothetical protein